MCFGFTAALIAVVRSYPSCKARAGPAQQPESLRAQDRDCHRSRRPQDAVRYLTLCAQQLSTRVYGLLQCSTGPKATVMDTTCVCGRAFSQLNAFTNHIRTCPRSKKRLSSALESAKEKWTTRKRRRVAVEQSPGDVWQPAGLIPLASTAEVLEEPLAQPNQVCHNNTKGLTPLLNPIASLCSIIHQTTPTLP